MDYNFRLNTGPNSNPLKNPRVIYLLSRTRTGLGHAIARYVDVMIVVTWLATKRGVVVVRSVSFFSLIVGRDYTVRQEEHNHERCHCERCRRESCCNRSSCGRGATISDISTYNYSSYDLRQFGVIREIWRLNCTIRTWYGTKNESLSDLYSGGGE